MGKLLSLIQRKNLILTESIRKPIVNICKMNKNSHSRRNTIKGTNRVWETDVKREIGYESLWKETSMSEYDENQFLSNCERREGFDWKEKHKGG